jgi:DNA-binding transcriptional regulator GbsR (MarR family)
MDIVERLQYEPCSEGLQQEAADEITKLRAELAEAKTCLKWSYQNLYSMADPAMVKRTEAAMRTTEESSVDGETK